MAASPAMQLMILPPRNLVFVSTYRWHNHLALEASADSVVDTLGLSPAGVETFVGVRSTSD